ncbi:hypothetical protein GH714_041334 [Hevea brasiliensis]|uniref:Exonuclease domain-containing protein n=1 Tax=Hevea brasiliensis TaxID=3981 RepID=A0A6A6MY13_HEVBR|nr:hypothetical protein GH714_041334 [Hevea brasiliensis]
MMGSELSEDRSRLSSSTSKRRFPPGPVRVLRYWNSEPSLYAPGSWRSSGATRPCRQFRATFGDIADTVYEILHGRIWAGHNILRFDCVRIREAFAEIARPPPEPKGIIDSLALLTQKFGRRAGDMKMASLATYFGLGKQTHRSLDDVRMNLEVLKYCATVLFLESSLPDAFPEKSWVSPNATTRSRTNGKSLLEGLGINIDAPSSSSKFENFSPGDHGNEGNHPLFSQLTIVASKTSPPDSFDMGSLSNEMRTNYLQQDVAMEEKPMTVSSEMPSAVTVPEGWSGNEEF